jgi:hypothetical protein
MADCRTPRHLILLLGMLLITMANIMCEGTHEETGILISWKNKIDDPNATLHDWESSPVSPCNWTGIVCDTSNLQVVDIDLSNLGLSGTLETILGQLQFLASFNITSKDFSGKLFKKGI